MPEERKKKPSEVNETEEGLRYCEVRSSEFPPEEREEFTKECIVEWLSATPQEREKLRSDLTEVPKAIKSEDICIEGRKYAPDEETADAFERWCRTQQPAFESSVQSARSRVYRKPMSFQTAKPLEEVLGKVQKIYTLFDRTGFNDNEIASLYPSFTVQEIRKLRRAWFQARGMEYAHLEVERNPLLKRTYRARRAPSPRPKKAIAFEDAELVTILFEKGFRSAKDISEIAKIPLKTVHKVIKELGLQRATTEGDAIRRAFEEDVLSDAQVAQRFPQFTEADIREMRDNWRALIPAGQRPAESLEERAIKFYRQHFTIPQIARELDITPAQVEKFVAAESPYFQALRLHRQGLRAPEIAKVLKIPIDRVHIFLSLEGIGVRFQTDDAAPLPTKISREDLEFVAILYEKGHRSAKEISKLIKMPYKSVLKIVKDLGLGQRTAEGDAIRIAFEDGILSDAQIAQKFSQFTEADIQKMRANWDALGPRPKKTKSLEERVRKMFRRHHSVLQIAKKLRMPPAEVENLLAAESVYFRALQLHRQGRKAPEIARRLQIPIEKVQAVLISEGIGVRFWTDMGASMVVGHLTIQSNVMELIEELCSNHPEYLYQVQSETFDGGPWGGIDLGPASTEIKRLPIERGVVLCAPNFDPSVVIYGSPIREGHPAGVDLSPVVTHIKRHHPEYKIVGEFHTHPDGLLSLSEADLRIGGKDNLEMLAVGGTLDSSPVSRLYVKKSKFTFVEIIDNLVEDFQRIEQEFAEPIEDFNVLQPSVPWETVYIDWYARRIDELAGLAEAEILARWEEEKYDFYDRESQDPSSEYEPLRTLPYRTWAAPDIAVINEEVKRFYAPYFTILDVGETRLKAPKPGRRIRLPRQILDDLLAAKEYLAGIGVRPPKRHPILEDLIRASRYLELKKRDDELQTMVQASTLPATVQAMSLPFYTDERGKKIRERLKEDFPHPVTLPSHKEGFEKHTDPGKVTVGSLKLPMSLLEKMKRAVESTPFRPYLTLDVSRLNGTDALLQFKTELETNEMISLEDLAQKFELGQWRLHPLAEESGFIICKDVDGMLYSSDLIQGSAGGMSLQPHIEWARRNQLTPIGCFHTHYHGALNLSDVDLQAMTHFQLECSAVGGTFDDLPIVVIYQQQRPGVWQQIIRAFLWWIANQSTASSLTEVQKYAVYDHIAQIPTTYDILDTRLKMMLLAVQHALYRPYLDIMGVDLADWSIFTGAPPTVTLDSTLIMRFLMWHNWLAGNVKRAAREKVEMDLMYFSTSDLQDPAERVRLFEYFRTTFQDALMWDLQIPLTDRAIKATYQQIRQALAGKRIRFPAPTIRPTVPIDWSQPPQASPWRTSPANPLEPIKLDFSQIQLSPWITRRGDNYAIDTAKMLTNPPEGSPWTLPPARARLHAPDVPTQSVLRTIAPGCIYSYNHREFVEAVLERFDSVTRAQISLLPNMFLLYFNNTMVILDPIGRDNFPLRVDYRLILEEFLTKICNVKGKSLTLKDLHLKIVISHLHPDHWSGLATLLTQYRKLVPQKQIEVMLHREASYILEDYQSRYEAPENAFISEHLHWTPNFMNQVRREIFDLYYGEFLPFHEILRNLKGITLTKVGETSLPDEKVAQFEWYTTKGLHGSGGIGFRWRIRNRVFFFVDDLLLLPVALTSSCLPHTNYRELKKFYQVLNQLKEDDLCICSHLGRKGTMEVADVLSLISRDQRDFNPIQEFIEANRNLKFQELYTNFLFKTSLEKGLLKQLDRYLSPEFISKILSTTQVILKASLNTDIHLESNPGTLTISFTYGTTTELLFIKPVRYSILFLIYALNILYFYWDENNEKFK